MIKKKVNITMSYQYILTALIEANLNFIAKPSNITKLEISLPYMHNFAFSTCPYFSLYSTLTLLFSDILLEVISPMPTTT